jgi:predicted TPR repeat methyltransferase
MVDRKSILTPGERAWLDRFVMPLPRGGTILDLGCGGGEPVARYLIDSGFRMVGVDISETLIELAQVRFPRDRWLVGDMRRIVIDERFDGVLVWNCLAYLPRADQAAMAERVDEWMKPDARLLFNVRTTAETDLEGFRPGSRFRDDLETADYSAALARRGLLEMAHVEHDPACDNAAVWLVRKV